MSPEEFLNLKLCTLIATSALEAREQGYSKEDFINHNHAVWVKLYESKMYFSLEEIENEVLQAIDFFNSFQKEDF